MAGYFPVSGQGSSHDRSLFTENQTIEIVGQIGQCQFRLRSLDTDGADEQAQSVLLVRENVFDLGTDHGLDCIGSCQGFAHRLALERCAEGPSN